MSAEQGGGGDGTAIAPVLKSRYSAREQRPGYDLEDPFQIEAAAMLDVILPDDCVWCHIPNGGKRPRKTAGLLKKMGQKAGMPDNLILWRGRPYWVELKARKGVLKDSQKEMIPRLEAAGSPVAVARTLSDIVACLTGWGIPLKMTLEEYRNPLRKSDLPQRMSAAQYKAVMGLSQPAEPKRKTSWQKTPAAARRRTAMRGAGSK